MIKLVCILAKDDGKGRRFRLFESCMGHFSPAADSQLRPGVIDDSEDLKVITDSVLRFPDGARVKFTVPKYLASKGYSELNGVEQLFVRKQLGKEP